MADHCRAQIRAAIVAALTGLPTTGARVYSGRTHPLPADADSSLLVYATEERAELSTMGPQSKLSRTLTVMVDGRASASGAEAAADLEDTLDQIAKEVEPAFSADPSLGGLALAITFASARLAVQAQGELHVGVIHLEFEVIYRTTEAAPDVAA